MDILPFMHERAAQFSCPRCRHSLADCQLRLLQQRGAHYTVQVTCRSCALTLVVALELRSEADAAREAIPARRAARPAPVSGEEVLDVHLRLRDHAGPLSDLLRPPADG